MIARYYKQGFAAAIYTDEPINSNDQRFKFFLEELENVPGVEQTQAGKYYVEIAFAYLFEPDDVLKQCLRLFSQVYQIEIGERISEEERITKIMENSAVDL